MPHNGRVFPLNQGRFAGFDVHGLHLRVGNVALVLQLAQEILSGFQIQNPNVAHVVRGILPNRIVAAVVQQEGYAVERLPGGGVRFMEQNPGLRHVRDGHSCGLAVRDGEILRRRVDFVALRRLDFDQIVVPGVKAGVDSPVAARRDFLYKPAVNRPDFKGRVGQTLRLVGAVELDNFDAAILLVVEGHRLRFPGLHQNALRGRVQHITICGSDFLRRNGRSRRQPGQHDASVAVSRIFALIGADCRAAGIRDKEHHALNRVRCAFFVLLNRENFLRLVVEG